MDLWWYCDRQFALVTVSEGAVDLALEFWMEMEVLRISNSDTLEGIVQDIVS